MKTLYISNRGNITVDTDNNSCGWLNTERESISRIYLAKEPMHVVYEVGMYKREMDVEKDDIIIVFYEDAFKHKIIVVKNDDWANNLIEYSAEEQKRLEEWAKSKSENTCPCDCECAMKPF